MTIEPSNEVGYGRPPIAHQFPKGVSGNPAGRRKGSRGVSAVISAALSERVTVIKDGKRRSISKLEAALTQLTNQAAGGDPKATKLILELLGQFEARDDARASGVTVTPEDRQKSDAAILAVIMGRQVAPVSKSQETGNA